MTRESEKAKWGDDLKREARENTARIDPMARQFGDNIRRLLIEPGLAKLAAVGVPDTRCGTCAFREGTVPAQCLQTQADAFKALIEDVPFYCHAHMDAEGKPDTVCHGWIAGRVSLIDAPPMQAPWEFSDERTEEPS